MTSTRRQSTKRQINAASFRLAPFAFRDFVNVRTSCHAETSSRLPVLHLLDRQNMAARVRSTGWEGVKAGVGGMLQHRPRRRLDTKRYAN